jgi:tRNA uridine 5-carboxymethylaminomethyl modification enzyme
MIDDLVTLGTNEPYRMFTSRAEYRLTLRADNADQRLTGRGIDIGLVGKERRKVYEIKDRTLRQARQTLDSLTATPPQLRALGLQVNMDGQRRTATNLLAYADVNVRVLARIWPQLSEIEPDIVEQLENDAHYSGYLERQEADIRSFKRDEALEIPGDLDFAGIPGLSNEVRSKLEESRPATLGAAARISGVTPAALTALLGRVRRRGGGEGIGRRRTA